MITRCFSKVELRYNQTAESVIIRVYLRYDSDRMSLFDEMDNLVFNVKLPDGVTVKNPSYTTIGLVEKTNSKRRSCGFPQAVDIVESKRDLVSFKPDASPYTFTINNIIFQRDHLPPDDLCEIIVLLPLSMDETLESIQSGVCELSVFSDDNSECANESITIRFGRRVVHQLENIKKPILSWMCEEIKSKHLMVPPSRSPSEIKGMPVEMKLDRCGNHSELSPDDIVSKRMRILVSDMGGVGKTILAQQITERASQKDIPTVYIDCALMSNEIQTSSMTIAELATMWVTEISGRSIVHEDFFNIAVGRGNALIILDGIDMLSTESIKKLISQIETLLETTTCPVIILTRPLANAWSLFKRVRLPYQRQVKRITDKDKKRFAHSWFSAFPAEKRGIKRMNQDFRQLLKSPILERYLSTPSGLNKICLLMSYKHEIGIDTSRIDYNLMWGALSSFKDNIPRRLKEQLKDREIVSSLSMKSSVNDLLPATCATIFNAIQYGQSSSKDDIISELAIHFVNDGERGREIARDTATDMINICGPHGLGLFKFEGGRIVPINRSFLEYFASKDRAVGFKTEEYWGNRLIEDGPYYPGSGAMQVASFLFLVQERRPRLGFDMLTHLAQSIRNHPDAVGISAMVFGKALKESGRLLSAKESRKKAILAYSKNLHHVLTKISGSIPKIPWSPWQDTEDIADSIWNTCGDGDSSHEINLALEIAELTGSVSKDTYRKYLQRASKIGMGAGTFLPMSVKADPYKSEHLIEPILKLGAGWLLNNHHSAYFDKKWPMPLAFINNQNSIIWEYCGFKIEDILNWINKIHTTPWSLTPSDGNPLDDLNRICRQTPKRPFARYALALAVLAGQVRTLGYNSSHVKLTKNCRVKELTDYIKLHLDGRTDGEAWWKMVNICKKIL